MTAKRLAALLAEPALAAVLGALDRDGEEARVVGGAVRDALLGRIPTEIDIATTAVPDEVVRRAKAAGFRSAPTGIAHGTVTLIGRGRTFEVTTLRRDVDTDGRHAVVEFGRDWAGDALRRDFTINGLSLSRDGCVHDAVGGLADLAARRVRFIGDPAARIREDYLRILRFFRFHASHGSGAPDPAGFLATVRERAGLARLSRERVHAELLKLLAAARGPETAVEMAEAGLLGAVLGGVPRTARLLRLAAIERELGRVPDPLLRLGAVALFVREDAGRLVQWLRLSRHQAGRLGAMSEGFATVPDEMAAKAVLYREGAVALADRALLSWASAPLPPAGAESWRQAVELPGRWIAPDFPLTGDRIMARGVPKGPRVGALRRAVEARWIAADFPSEPGWLERALDEEIARA